MNLALLAGFFWYWCYYLRRSRDALSPECGIFPHNFGTQFFTLFVHQIFALNLFKLLSKPFFHKIILQICHPTIQPIFSTHLHQFFFTNFSKKNHFLNFSTQFFNLTYQTRILSRFFHTIFLPSKTTQFSNLICITKLFHTICPPYFSPNLSKQFFHPLPSPPHLFSIKLTFF